MMTEADYLEIAQLNLTNMIATFALFVTFASGYLVAAYLIGDKLTRSQIVIINSLFIIVMGLGSSTMHTFAVESYTLNQAAEQLGSITTLSQTSAGIAQIYFARFTDLLILAGCLKFMWDKRHPK